MTDRVTPLIELPLPVLEIESDLLSKRIGPLEALQKLQLHWRSSPRAWHTKAWKEARGQLIGTSCIKCGSAKGLTLQHLVPRKRWRDHFREAGQNHVGYQKRSAARLQHYSVEKAKIEKAAPELRNCCPKCNSTSIYYRKKTRDWKCNGTRRKRTCSFEFPEPNSTVALTLETKKSIAAQKRVLWETLSKADFKDRRRTLTKPAILLWLADQRDYLSLEHTTTYCKKCAFLEDKLGMHLCPNCKTEYLRYGMPCRTCSSEDPA